MKTNALITLKNDENNQIYKVNLELKKNIYRYEENQEEKTLVEFDSNRNILKRENNNLSMEFLFVEKKTSIGKIFVKNIDKYIDVIIKTEMIKKIKSNVQIRYYLENKLYEYSIDME